MSGRGGFVDEFPVAGCCDNQLGVVIEAFQRNLLNRCFEVCHIQTALERGRQGMVFQRNDDVVALLADVGLPGKAQCRQFDNAGIFAVFAEIDIGLFCLYGRRLLCCGAERCGYGYYGLGKRCGSLLFCRRGRRGFYGGAGGGGHGIVRFVDENPNFISAYFGIVLARFVQIQNQTRTAAVLCGTDFAQQRVGILEYLLIHGNAGLFKVQGDARGRRSDEAGRVDNLFVKADFDDFLFVGQGGNFDVCNVSC